MSLDLAVQMESTVPHLFVSDVGHQCLWLEEKDLNLLTISKKDK